MQKVIDRAQTALTRVLMALLVLVMLVLCARMFTQHVLVNRLSMDNGLTRFVLGGAAARADQAEDTPAAPQPVGTGPLAPFQALRKLQYDTAQAARRVTAVVEEHATQGLPYRSQLVAAANAYEDKIRWNLARTSDYNSAVELEAGYLTDFSLWVDVSNNFWHAADFKNYLNARQTPLLFVQLPGKVSRDDKEVNNVVDFYNNNADRLVAGMRNYGVNVLDLREHITATGADYQALFFNTDHHWRPETGLWAAGIIAEELQYNFYQEIDASLLKPENFRKDVYQRWFMGSQGMKLTEARAVPDDISLIYPTFPVNMTIRIPSIGLEQTGGFEVVYDMTQMQEDGRPYNDLAYGAYLHSGTANHPFVQILNHSVPDRGNRILMIGDSFATTLMPFLALDTERLDLVDLRHYEGSLHALIEEQQYTMVVIAYSEIHQYEAVSGKSMYDFR